MKNVSYIILLIIIGLLPLFIAIGLIYGYHGKWIGDSHLVISEVPETDPRQYIDEVYYWHQIKTFRVAGFDGGYYTIAEEPASMETIRYFSWGPVPIVFYGVISFFTGFGQLQFVLINTILLLFGIILLGYTVKLNKIQFAMIATLLVVYPGIILYMPYMLMEIINLIIAIYLAVVFYKLLEDDYSPTPIFFALSLSLFIFAGFFRISWAVVYPPAFMFVGWKIKRWFGAGVGAILSVLFGTAIYIVFNMISAPFDSMIVLSADINSILSAVQERLLYNLGWSFLGLTFWILMRMAVLVIVIGVTYQGVMMWLRHSDYEPGEIFFHLVNLVGIVFVNLTLYWFVEGRDFRVIEPHLLVSILLLIMLKRYRLVFPIIMIFVMGTPNLLKTHEIWTEAHYHEIEFDFANYQTQLEDAGVVYIENDNGWCNTVSFTNEIKWTLEYLQGIEGGLGLTQFADVGLYDDPPLSHYLFLDPETQQSIPVVWQLETLLETPAGTIYRNLDAGCSPIP